MKIATLHENLIFTPECDMDMILVGKLLNRLDITIEYDLAMTGQYHKVDKVTIKKNDLIKLLNEL